MRHEIEYAWVSDGPLYEIETEDGIMHTFDYVIHARSKESSKNVWTHFHSFDNIEDAENAADKINEILTIDKRYWVFNERLSMSLEERLNFEAEQEYRARNGMIVASGYEDLYNY